MRFNFRPAVTRPSRLPESLRLRHRPTLTVALDNKVKTYGSANPVLTATIRASWEEIRSPVRPSSTRPRRQFWSRRLRDHRGVGDAESDFNYGFNLRTHPPHRSGDADYTANAASGFTVRPIRSFRNPYASSMGKTQATATNGTLIFASPADSGEQCRTYAVKRWASR